MTAGPGPRGQGRRAGFGDGSEAPGGRHQVPAPQHGLSPAASASGRSPPRRHSVTRRTLVQSSAVAMSRVVPASCEPQGAPSALRGPGAEAQPAPALLVPHLENSFAKSAPQHRRRLAAPAGTSARVSPSPGVSGVRPLRTGASPPRWPLCPHAQRPSHLARRGGSAPFHQASAPPRPWHCWPWAGSPSSPDVAQHPLGAGLPRRHHGASVCPGLLCLSPGTRCACCFSGPGGGPAGEGRPVPDA